MEQAPATLQEAIVYFSDPANCLEYLAKKRWPAGVVICPTCSSSSVSFLANQLRWQCSSHHPKRQFSIKVGTIMEDSAIPLDKWLMAMWMVTNCKNGISSYEIAKDVKVTQKSAWFMLHRIRLAMQDETSGNKLSGHVEVDHATPVVGQHQEHVKDLETDRRYREEVDRDQLFDMILQESAPCL